MGTGKTEVLKTCPFCGEKAWGRETDYGYRISCGECDFGIERLVKDEAITAWNTRHYKKVCSWWNSCQYGKWEDGEIFTNAMGQPVLIQEKRCKTCNKSKRRVEVI